MSSDPEDSREQGVEFGDLAAKLDDHDYPASLDELVAAYGDEELELPDGATTFEEAVSPYLEADQDETYEDAGEVRQDVLNLVGSDAVGRQEYSDRGTTEYDEVEEGGEGGADESF